MFDEDLKITINGLKLIIECLKKKFSRQKLFAVVEWENKNVKGCETFTVSDASITFTQKMHAYLFS